VVKTRTNPPVQELLTEGKWVKPGSELRKGGVKERLLRAPSVKWVVKKRKLPRGT